jgi:branched-chain amino acid transport system permease protein
MSILPQLIINSIIAGSIYSMVALGFNLIYGTTKFFNLAHGVLAAVGGYAVFYLTKSLDLPLVPGVIIGLLIAGLVGYLMDKSVFRPFANAKLQAWSFLLPLSAS